jgi:hypothetical protein
MKPAEQIIRTDIEMKKNFKPETHTEAELSYAQQVWCGMNLKERRELFKAVKHYMVLNTQPQMINMLKSAGAHNIRYGKNLCLNKREGDTWDNIKELYFGGFDDTKHRGLFACWVMLFQSMAKRYGYELDNKESEYNWLTDHIEDLGKPIDILA